MSGTTDKIKGCVKKAVGVVTDNQRLKGQGTDGRGRRQGEESGGACD
jgi:uncharacterized protein YjbJ (UPF0337 family)